MLWQILAGARLAHFFFLRPRQAGLKADSLVFPSGLVQIDGSGPWLARKKERREGKLAVGFDFCLLELSI